MTDSRAIQFRATETGFEPLGIHAFAAFKKQYQPGQRYVLTQHRERSGKSHRHLFSVIKETFDNLPDRWAEMFSSPEALRKYLLVRAGWCDAHTFTCETPEEAKRLVRYLKPIDEFSIVTAKDCVVTRYAAKSISEQNMGSEDFNAVKDKVLDIAAKMIGVSKAALTKNAGRAA